MLRLVRLRPPRLRALRLRPLRIRLRRGALRLHDRGALLCLGGPRRADGGLALLQPIHLALEAAVRLLVVAEGVALRLEAVAFRLRLRAALLRLREGITRCRGVARGPGARDLRTRGGGPGLATRARLLLQRVEQTTARLERRDPHGQRGVLPLEARDRLGRGRVEALDLLAQRARGLGRARGSVARLAPRLLVAFESKQARQDVAARARFAPQEGVERALRQQHGLRECHEVEPEQRDDAIVDVLRAIGEGLPRAVHALPLEPGAEVAGRLPADPVALSAHAEVELHGHRARAVRD